MNKTKYIVDLGVLGEVEFYVTYSVSAARRATHWEPGEPATVEVLSAQHEVLGAEINGLVTDFLNGDGHEAFCDQVWQDDEADRADYEYQLWKDSRYDSCEWDNKLAAGDDRRKEMKENAA